MRKEAVTVVGIGIAAFVIYKFLKFAPEEGEKVGLKRRDYPNP
jgi:plastocyanin domain-containing protein